MPAALELFLDRTCLFIEREPVGAVSVFLVQADHDRPFSVFTRFSAITMPTSANHERA